MPLRTCKHIYDTGGTCNSAAAVDRDYCVYHLSYRARQLRMAQRRARNERFDFKLPPLENMFAVHSALNQIAEAVAADMLDLKRARLLLSVVRAAGQFLLHPEKWQANPYHTDVAAPAIDLAAEYGLPADLDLNTPPEMAFPSPLAPAASGTRHWPLATDHSPVSGPQLPDVGNCGNAIVPDDLRTPHVPDNFNFTPDYPITPEYVELDEVSRTLGSEASSARSTQLVRNQGRRRLHSERKRYAKIAARINLYRAAEKLAERKLAEQAAAAGSDSPVPKKPSVSEQLAALAEKEAKSIA